MLIINCNRVIDCLTFSSVVLCYHRTQNNQHAVVPKCLKTFKTLSVASFDFQMEPSRREICRPTHIHLFSIVHVSSWDAHKLITCHEAETWTAVWTTEIIFVSTSVPLQTFLHASSQQSAQKTFSFLSITLVGGGTKSKAILCQHFQTGYGVASHIRDRSTGCHSV
jgi:hypothetical protein